MRAIFITLVSVVTFGCAIGPMAVIAQNSHLATTVVIMGLDQDRDTIPVTNRVYNRTLGALTTPLINSGFFIVDESQIARGRFDINLGDRRTDDLIRDVIATYDSPIVDIAVLFRIYPKATEREYSNEIGARIEARLVNLRAGDGGRRIGNFEVQTEQRIMVSKDCDRECLWESLGDETRILARDLGRRLAIRLEQVVASPQTTLAITPTPPPQTALERRMAIKLEGFEPAEVRLIEEYLVNFDGYISHRNNRCQPGYCEIDLSTTSDSARLQRNLSWMLDHLKMKMVMVFLALSNTVRIEKIANPRGNS